MHTLETWSFCLLAINIVKNMGNPLPLQWMVSDTQQAKAHPSKWSGPGETFPSSMWNFNIMTWATHHYALQYEHTPCACLGRSHFPADNPLPGWSTVVRWPRTPVETDRSHWNTNNLHGPPSKLPNALGLSNTMNWEQANVASAGQVPTSFLFTCSL